MAEADTRPAQESELDAVESALLSLARDLNDPYGTSRENLKHALFGAHPSAYAQIAGDAPDLLGIALFSPVYSTAKGGAGLYVSDLWVSAAARGQGLGPALLQSAAERATELWDARFLRLAVYAQSTGARRFYDALGFAPVTGETVMLLAGESFEQLRRAR